MMNKILSLDILKNRINKEKENGKKIVFTNGAFDLIHVGHIRYLVDASKLGDITICALNSDQSIRALKGKNRPVMPLEERVEIIAALDCIDYVISFDEKTVENLLMELKPHIHAKGTDYTKESVPEVETVKSYGGEVAITGDPKDHNTTDIIQRIMDMHKEKF